MKKHPLVERVDGIAPDIEKLPNAVRSRIKPVIAAVREYIVQAQSRAANAGTAARGKSGRPVTEIPAVAAPYLDKIRSGEMTANRAATELRENYPNADCKFSPQTLRKWAGSVTRK